MKYSKYIKCIFKHSIRYNTYSRCWGVPATPAKCNDYMVPCNVPLQGRVSPRFPQHVVLHGSVCPFRRFHIFGDSQNAANSMNSDRLYRSAAELWPSRTPLKSQARSNEAINGKPRWSTTRRVPYKTSDFFKMEGIPGKQPDPNEAINGNPG